MITIQAISQVQYEEHDEVWAVVRSMKHPNKNIKQVTDLSPSWDLFGKYREKANNKKWNEHVFQEMYVPQFLEEMHSEKAKQLLNQLYIADKQGKRIALVCFCPDETTCHRSIIAGLLQGAGCNVTGVKQDYSRFYEMYQEVGKRQDSSLDQKIMIRSGKYAD